MSLAKQIQENQLPEITKQNGRQMYQEAKVGAIIPQNVAEVVTLAKALHESGLFPNIKNAAQAVAMIIAGAEMGMPPMASLNGFHIVQGKIMTHYSTIGAGVRRAGYNYRVVTQTDILCELMFIDRDGSDMGLSKWDAEDAKRASTQNMGKFPRTMLFARAMSNGARQYTPEAFNGLIVYEHGERFEIEAEARESGELQESTSVQRLTQKLHERTEGVEEFYDPFPIEDDAPFVPNDVYTGPTVDDEQGELGV